MHIVHVAPEMAPLIKVGGLGDVVGALPIAQAALGHRVTVVLPAYGAIRERLSALGELDELGAVGYRVGGEELLGALRRARFRGVDLLLIERDVFFAREGVYGDRAGSYGDNGLRFGWFCGATLSALRRLDELPDAIFCHDWTAALLPALLRAHPLPRDPLAGTGTIQVIHNLAHQGVFDLSVARALDLPDIFLGPDQLEAMGALNMLKGGIRHATYVATVSPTYAREIVWPLLGEGLDESLRARGEDLVGVLNGLDLETWDPAQDHLLAKPYDAKSLDAKDDNKHALQRALGLREDTALPLFGMVSRVDPQKGIGLVDAVAPWLVERGAQLVLLGSGRAGMLDGLHGLAGIWQQSVAVIEAFDEELAHRIYAGSDFFLMPSLFEPCGLGQMVALRYGTPPIVRRTGGLADTVIDVDEEPEAGTGFVFNHPDAQGLRWACERALTWQAEGQERLREVRARGMRVDLSWERSASHYLRLARRAAQRERHRVLAL